jgi:hypothetical protein
VVISNASPMAKNVDGLVYVCAFIPDEGETLQGLAEQSTDSKPGPATGAKSGRPRRGAGDRVLH